MKLRNVVIFVLVTSMVISFTACTWQTESVPQEGTNIVQENVTEKEEMEEEISKEENSLEESSITESSQNEDVADFSDKKENLTKAETDEYEQDSQNSEQDEKEKQIEANENGEDSESKGSKFKKCEIKLNNSEKKVLSKQGKQLTEQITIFALDVSSFYENPIPYPNDIEIERFLMSIDLFEQQEDYPYINTHRIEQDGTCYFKKKSIDRIIEEMFNKVTWTPVSMIYNKENQEYTYTTGAGVGSNLECKNIETKFQSNDSKILISYELWTSSNYPDYHKIGDYQSVFSVCQRKEDIYYLQYLKTEKTAGVE